MQQTTPTVNDADEAFTNHQMYYVDNDHDGFGSGNRLLCSAASTAPAIMQQNNTDCNDADAGVHETADVLCRQRPRRLWFNNGRYALALLLTAPLVGVTNNTDCNDG